MKAMSSEISISFAATDSFSRHLAVVLVSVLKNNQQDRFVFHVLHRNISEFNQALLKSTAEKWRNGRIVFHKVDIEVFATAPLPSPHISVESYFRLMLPKILVDESRTLYLDVDILCCKGIRELWETNLDGFACAAVSEEMYPKGSLLHFARPEASERQEYFNAGVMLFNLDYIRANGLESVPFDILETWTEKIGYADQDVLNLAYHGKVKFISRKFNFMGKWGPERVYSPVVIRHFASFSQKPWNCKMMRFTWIPYAWHLAHSSYRRELAGFVLEHLRAFLYWKYSKNGRPCLDLFGFKVWHGDYSWRR